MKLKKSAIAVLVLIPIFAGGFIAQNQNAQQGARLLDQVIMLVSGRFVDTVNTTALYEKAARGLVRELNDPYTVLMAPKELASFNATTGGRYGGIGMEIAEVQNWVTVQRVFPHTPASKGGVVEGDRIIQIDTASTRGWTTAQVSDALKGEPGTKVNVKFSRPGVTEPIPITFTRAIVHIPAVPFAIMLDDKVGYVPLLQFNETATEEMDNAMQQLIKGGARGLVIDLRSNPGGILDQALSVSNLFLRPGQEISSVRGRNTDPQTFVARDKPTVPNIPVVILTDGRSASASEIVAGALQDHDRALIIGTTSFGKGLVQTVFPLEGGYALKMTTAKWYTPSGRSIQKERKLTPEGEFVEVVPDSMESEATRKAKPAFKSDMGRVVYGGGGITPDIIVAPDTLTTKEQKLFNALAPKQQIVAATLQNYALELKGQIKDPNFIVTKAWREELFRRLNAQGVGVEKSSYDAASTEIDRLIGNRVAGLAFGDSAAKRRDLPDDNQLNQAITVLRQARSIADLFVIAKSKVAHNTASK